ncbi:hypothetical protein M422DRAFT_41524 [Sphaerobolus stellatus SS14]|nr:hypothetical protein M422DRAFT_41524 [Sphaerobolus stellatus SS14]
MSDGARLRQSWAAALTNAEAQFRSLLASAGSSSWKRVQLPPPPPQRSSSQTLISNVKGKGRSISPEDIVMHRRQTKQGDVMRVALDLPFEGTIADLDKWRAVLSTPELREEWDPAVESSSLVEMFDWNTRITRTSFALGWPANPRDAVTISKTFYDATTLIDISTSLPRSPDEPAYLRPAPPYVRSQVHLFAWCLQLLPVKAANDDNSLISGALNQKLRITCLWQHNLKDSWSFSSSLSQQLPTMVQGIIHVVHKRGHRIPLLCTYGSGISLDHMNFELGREALNIEYSVIVEDEDEQTAHSVKALEQVNEAKAKKRLERMIECLIPESTGWDIQITTRASSDAVAALPWKTTATRTPGDIASSYLTFHVKHSSMPDNHSVLKVKLVIELSGSSPGLRLNGLPHPVLETATRDPTSYTLSREILKDTSSVGGQSFQSLSTGRSSEIVSTTSANPQRSASMYNGRAVRSSAAEKMILTRVKRNYIYFSSLLQEPEAKWKRSSESRGVTISQLDSIDPTLVVYRAEAVFVGVGLWDLYSAIASPGARVQWDKTYEDALLLEDVNELTELWHWRTKPNWPVNARDVVLLKTVYKSPTTVHVFSFSTDDTQLFPLIPPTDPNVIRTQVDLQGWAIETLSPTTTLLTLLEQSDPRGWSGKSSIPQQMINAVAGAGEFAIKCGGPPINTRLKEARSLSQRYDHEKGSFRLEYEGCKPASNPPISDTSSSTSGGDGTPVEPSSAIPKSLESVAIPQEATIAYIECEIRCDLDTWAPSIDVVVDPPPLTVSCLRRHRLSNRGGGLWLTIGHDAALVREERLLVIVRKGSSKEKGLAVLNGAKVKIDVEEMPESEIKALTKMKRVKPPRFPLDQPPVLGVIRRRREQWSEENDDEKNNADSESSNKGGFFSWTSAPQISSPLAKFWTKAIEQTAATTSAAVNAATASLVPDSPPDAPLQSDNPPMANALSALAFLRKLHLDKSDDGWTVINDKGFPVHKRIYPEISTSIPVHKGEKVIEGVSAEEIAHVINNYDSRVVWDDRFDSALTLQEFGAGCHTAFAVCKGGFPFRDRGFYLANVTARLLTPAESPAAARQDQAGAAPQSDSTTIYCASASFNPSALENFNASKYNPHGLPIGRIMIHGWILETLDPYTTENYAIPSTRCTHIVSVDYAGSVPVAYNSMLNAAQPKTILAVEQYMKGNAALPLMRMPASTVTLFPDNNVNNTAEGEAAGFSWALERKDEKRLLVSGRYETSSKRFRAIVLLSVPRENDETHTPRPNPSLLPLLDSMDRLNTPASSPAPSPASTVRSRRISTSRSTIIASRSLSRDGPRSPTTAHALGETTAPDLIVGELVVDTKLYPDGYDVKIISQMRNPKQHTSPLSMPPLMSSARDLPILCSCHILPSTPLHSSGLNADAPPRHLLRFTLPTVKYETAVDNPLSLQPPDKPSWLTELESHGAVVEITTQPSERKSKGSVTFDGQKLEIMDDKDSIRLLRRELEDDRISRMSSLSCVSIAANSEEIPRGLVDPIAVATTLYDDKILHAREAANAVADGTDAPDESPPGTPGDDAKSENTVSLAPAGDNTQVPLSSTAGLFRFLNGYQNNLFRRGSPISDQELKSPPPSRVSSFQNIKDTSSSSVSSLPDRRTYPLSTVLIIALISFLLGSLFRSLLTPADFIYLSPDLNELDEGQNGWREIKRLVELKRIFGGWDFLVGAVRRH